MWESRLAALAALTALLLLGWSSASRAQVETQILRDGSLGDEFAPPIEDSGFGVFEIGEIHGERPGRGPNLFHSFLTFDLDAGDTALFTADLPTTNVISRVTGKAPSSIWGTIKSEIPFANLYLLNPYGVLFGRDAEVDVNGSFFVSTADELQFEGLDRAFVAHSGGSVPMEVAPPSAFGFWSESPVGESPAAINFEGSQLAMVPGRSFSAIAGRIEMRGPGDGSDVPSVRVSGGRIQLAAVSSGVVVPLQIDGVNLASVDPESAEVHLTDKAILDVTNSASAGAGRIVIRGGSFVMERPESGGESGLLKAFVNKDNVADPTAVDIAVTGELVIESGFIQTISDTLASGDLHLSGATVDLRNDSEILAKIGYSSTAEGADIHIGAGTLKVGGGAQVLTVDEESDNTTDVGDIVVVANAVEVFGEGSAILTQTLGSGATGDIRIGSEEAPLASLSVDGGAIFIQTAGVGTGGLLEVHASQVTVSTGDGTPGATGQISAVTTPGSSGPGGDVEIHADAIDLIDGGQIRVSTAGSGAGGRLGVHVAGLLHASGVATIEKDHTLERAPSGIFARSSLENSGPAGQLDITAGTLQLENGAEISTRSLSDQPAGALTIVADEVFVRGGEDGFSTISASTKDGPGGLLEIEADSLLLQDGGVVSATTNGLGDAGDVEITANEITIAGVLGFTESGVFAQTDGGIPGAGDGGSITLRPREGSQLALAIRDGGRVSVKSVGLGSAGVIDISGAERVEISNGGAISAQVNTVTLAPGEDPRDRASDIRILDTDTLILSNGTINSVTIGDGLGGSIEIEAKQVALSAGSRITAQSTGTLSNAGDAGSISIRATESLELSQGTITTEAKQAAGGDITLVGGEVVAISDSSKVSARAEGDGAAGNILVEETGAFSLSSGSTITAEASGTGQGGQITIRDVGDVFLSGGSSITTRSTAAEGGGDAGNIVIAAAGTFEAKSSAITTTADDAGGGRISVQAGQLVYLLDSQLETTVRGENAGENAGDIDIPLRRDQPGGPAPDVPEFVVINRSTIKANAKAADAGNITINGENVLISSDSLIEATSERGVSGEILIGSPDADIVSQIAQLPSSFVDPSDRILPPCAARTERTGSFMVQNREALPRPLDAPLPSTLGGAAGVGGIPPASGSTNCSVFQERS
jgi:filamentous hemagglutinin family protein